MNNSYFFEAGGHEFESEVVDVVSAYARRAWGESSVQFSTANQDRYEGTDLFVLGIPADITLAFAKKNRMHNLGHLTLGGVTVDFGLRLGNGKAEFETPVLVIGAKRADGITKCNMWVVLDTIKTYVCEILDAGMGRYYDAIDAMG